MNSLPGPVSLSKGAVAFVGQRAKAFDDHGPLQSYPEDQLSPQPGHDDDAVS